MNVFVASILRPGFNKDLISQLWTFADPPVFFYYSHQTSQSSTTLWLSSNTIPILWVSLAWLWSPLLDCSASKLKKSSATQASPAWPLRLQPPGLPEPHCHPPQCVHQLVVMDTTLVFNVITVEHSGGAWFSSTKQMSGKTTIARHPWLSTSS